jgi:hypothetical protein
MRFGLASTLLANGYFAFDYGDKDHGQIWHYDEYDVHLGEPTGSPRNALTFLSTNIKESVWRRDFVSGAVFVNATGSHQRIELDEEFEKIHGMQDSIHNDGSITSEVSLAPYDGILLLRPLHVILEKPFLNGSFARILTADGSLKRNGFFAYDNHSRGSASVIISDTVFKNKRVIASADRGTVTVRFAGGDILYTIHPFGKNWNLPLHISLGKNNTDDVSFFAVAPAKADSKKQTAPSAVKVYALSSGLQIASFQPFGMFKGAISISTGDINSDGEDEIVVGAGPGGGPHIRSFSAHGKPLHTNFFAYAKTFRDGVSLAIGDVLGLGNNQIITAPAGGKASYVRIFSADGMPHERSFSLSLKSSSQGTRIISMDMDGDGIDEIITFTANVFTIAGIDNS